MQHQRNQILTVPADEPLEVGNYINKLILALNVNIETTYFKSFAILSLSQ